MLKWNNINLIFTLLKFDDNSDQLELLNAFENFWIYFLFLTII